MALSFYLKVYGCQMNDYDGRRISNLLKSYQYVQVDDICNADIVIFYTCNIREKAVHKLRSDIGRVGKNVKFIAIGGCIAQAEGNWLLNFPKVKLVFGPQTYHRLPEYLETILHNEKQTIVDVNFYKLDKFKLQIEKFPIGTTAYVIIQEGCDNYCTYCVVPYTRGREYSRPVADILQEVKSLVSQGVQEVILFGQNVNSYCGEAPYITIGQNNTWSIDRLLLEIGEIDGIRRLRYATSNPHDFSEQLMQVHTRIPALSPFAHIPAQSGSDRILQLMNRKYTASEYLDKLNRFREICNNIHFSSDFIVGFPTETEEDLQQTVELIKKAHYTLSFSFKYSQRKNTPAARMKDQITENIKEQRLETLHQALLIDQIAFNKELVGTTQEVLFYKKGKKENQFIGKNIYQQSVVVESNENIIGSFKNVAITQAETNCVFGNLV